MTRTAAAIRDRMTMGADARFDPSDLAALWPVHGDEERTALERVLVGGHWTRLKDEDWSAGECGALEREFAAYIGADHVLAVANGTLAIELGLLGLGVGPGDEVIVQAGTFFGTVTPILRIGARPVFVDIEERSCAIDPDAVEAAITPRTAAVIAVHLAGQTPDMDRLAEICRRRSLALLEDCAQAAGTRWRDQAVGVLGDVGTFSLQGEKMLQAGEGGLVVSRDRAVAARVFARHQGFAMPGSPQPAKTEVAANMRLSPWQAAIARCQLGRLDEQVEHRRRNAERFASLLGPGDPVELVAPLPGVTRWSPFSLPMRLTDGAGPLTQRALIDVLEDAGLPVFEGHLEPLYRRPVFRDNELDYRDTGCPVTETEWRRHLVVLQPFLLGPPEWMDWLADLVRDAAAAAADLG